MTTEEKIYELFSIDETNGKMSHGTYTEKEAIKKIEELEKEYKAIYEEELAYWEEDEDTNDEPPTECYIYPLGEVPRYADDTGCYYFQELTEEYKNEQLIKEFCEEQGEDENRIEFYKGLFKEMMNNNCGDSIEDCIITYQDNFEGIYDTVKDFLRNILIEHYNLDENLSCYIDYDHFERDCGMDYEKILYKGKYYIFRIV